jgi:hypothetical protein
LRNIGNFVFLVIAESGKFDSDIEIAAVNNLVPAEYGLAGQA